MKENYLIIFDDHKLDTGWPIKGCGYWFNRSVSYLLKN